MRILTGLLALGLLGAFGGCKAKVSLGGGETVGIDVECETVAGPAVDCTIAETKGAADVEVCWDFVATCPNGTVVTAPRSCAKVKDGGRTPYRIPGDQLTNVAQCTGEGETRAAVANITVDGKPMPATPTEAR